LVKKLREETSAGIIDCKRALVESEGNYEKAKEILHKQGLDRAEKKMSRVAIRG